MNYDPEKVIRIATKLKVAREQVEQLEEQLRVLILAQGQNSNQPARKRKTKGLSEAASKIVQFFNNEPQKNFSAEEVWTVLNIPETYARPLLSKLAKENQIEKRGRGLYGATTLAEVRGLAVV